MSPEAWSATAAWVTVVIAVVAAIFGFYQVREARRTRQEQAQPNVVMFVESTPSHFQFFDIVLRNFGTTPAYNVTVDIAPKPTRTPEYEGAEIEQVGFPDMTQILVPGQEVRTYWDFAVDRETHNEKLRSGHAAGQIDAAELAAKALIAQHTATVQYEDSHGKTYQTRSTLDADFLRDTMKTTTYTIHDLTKHAEKQQEALKAIAQQLANFGTEQRGLWVYSEDAATESQRRADERQARLHSRKTLNQRILESQRRYSGHQPEIKESTDPDNATNSTPGGRDPNSTDDGTAEPSPSQG